MKHTVKALFLGAAFAVSGFAQTPDTASVTFNVNLDPPSAAAVITNATITATLKEYSVKHPDITVTAVVGRDTVVKFPLQQNKTTGVLYGAQNHLSVPVISANRDGRISLNLPTQSYNNADIALFSVNGKRVLKGKASATEAGLSVSRTNVARGVYLLSVKGTKGEEFTSRLTHGGGALNIDVAFGAENLSPSHKLAKQAASGDWTIKISSSGYVDTSYTLNPENKSTPKQAITLKKTPVNTPPTASERQKRTISVDGTTPGRTFDLTLPDTGNGPFPLIMFIFGGGFTGGTKTVGTPFSSGPKKGYATAALEYRLASSSNKAFPGAVEDLLAAIRHLRANAVKYHLDPDKFVVTGFSAGGYMTGLINSISGSSSPAHPFNETSGNVGISSQVQAAVSCAALTDFTKLNSQQQELGGSWMLSNHYADGQSLNLFFGMKIPTNGPTPNTPLDTAFRNSNPLTYITQANCKTLPPIMMVHGTSDNLVPWKQSELLVNKINEVCGNGKAELVKHSGGHADCPSANEKQIFDFIDSKLGIKR